MKLKDIEVGKEYAIGAPNATYDRWSRVRGRIVKVGVYGQIQGDFGFGHLSEKASYVEFEPIDCGHVLWRYGITLVADARVRGGERLPDRYHKDEKSAKREAHRCLGSHVIMPWDEYVELKAEHVRRREAVRDRAERTAKRCLELAREFEKILGPGKYCHYGDTSIRLGLKQAEELLSKIETLVEQKNQWEAATHATQARLDEALAEREED